MGRSERQGRKRHCGERHCHQWCLLRQWSLLRHALGVGGWRGLGMHGRRRATCRHGSSSGVPSAAAAAAASYLRLRCKGAWRADGRP